MIRITYLSEETAPFSPEALLGLLTQCHANNPRRGLTGLLVYGNGTFLQSLEGEVAAVDALMEKIARDPRHQNLRMLRRESITERLHADWSMGFERLTDEALKNVPGLRDFSLKEFNSEYLSTHAEVVESLLDRHRAPHWDPLVRELDARDKLIVDLRQALATLRQRNEMAALVLDAVIESAEQGRLADAQLDLCRSMLKTLRTAR